MTDRRPLPVTAIVSTKNESLAIRSCLDHLAEFDQVIVVDSMSADNTVELSRAVSGVEVVDFEWNGSYPKKKQWCLNQLNIRNQWILFVDADEYPTPELLGEIHEIVTCPHPQHVAYDIPLAYHFQGRRLLHGHQVVKRVLARRDSIRFPELNDLAAPGMGELEGHYQPSVAGSVGMAVARLAHDDPDPLASWIARHNKYSDWEAYLRSHPQLSRDIRRLRSGQGRIFDAVPFKPLLFFIYSYIVKRGFLDGRAGLTYALSLSWYYWTISTKVREHKRVGPS